MSIHQFVPAFLSCLTLAAGPATIMESEREIPVVHDVDVVVVGGSTGAVAAALAAREEGASVFLAAPRSYLGEDMGAHLRVWLEADETPSHPLARRIFAEDTRSAPVLRDDERSVAFNYAADMPSGGQHPDAKETPLLTDWRWGTAAGESVQYSGDPTILCTFRRIEEPKRVLLMMYHNKDYLFSDAVVELSEDGETWREGAVLTNTAPPVGDDHVPALVLAASLGGKAKQARIRLKGAEGAERVLVGEILFTASGSGGRGDSASIPRVVRPLHVKKVLDAALLEAEIPFLFSCLVGDVLKDAGGQPCGITLSSRAGRQAVLAKVVIDATERGTVARLAGAGFRSYPGGKHTFTRVVVGGEPREEEDAAVREIEPSFQSKGGTYRIFEYTMQLPMADGSFREWMKAEHAARDLTYHPDQQSTSDSLFQVPPDPMFGRTTLQGEWPGASAADLDAFRPDGIERLYLLGGCADIAREAAARMLRPAELMAIGDRIGRAAAGDAKSAPVPRVASVAAGSLATGPAADVREFLSPLRPTDAPKSVKQPARPIPVFGEFDVVVVGGGTGGAPAGIGAARQGATTLVIEALHGLGGVGTLGAISKYYWGNRVGFTAEVEGGASWGVEQRAEWWRRSGLDAGAEIWFGSVGCGTIMDGNKVKGVIVSTPDGRGAVLARTVIDATGSATVAAMAGAECIFTDSTDIAVQGTGLPPRYLGRNYTNTDYTIADENDMLDVWRVFVQARKKASDAFDVGRLIDSRERRRIVGDFTISFLDQINVRTYPDSVVEARSNFDTHGYTSDPFFTLQFPHKVGVSSYIPYRAMLPKGMDGILVIGLGISAQRDAIPLIRMQPDIQNGGYAAGVAAAMIASAGSSTRQLDIKALQKHLIEIGNLKEDVLTHEDSYPPRTDRLEEAVKSVRKDFKGVNQLLTDPETSLPMVKEALAAAESPEERQIYSRILAVMGDRTGVDVLIDQVNAADSWDKGWDYKAMGQFGANMSPLDAIIFALGKAGDRRALPAILAKAKQLTTDLDFSHHRAVALALEMLRAPEAAPVLFDVLSQPGMRGHAIPSIGSAVESTKTNMSWTALASRRNSLRELTLARALYRCGDKDGLGRSILEEYARDMRGHWSTHARAVLAE